ncbi:hypothetical protein JCM3774_004915 [Rhodotorula dairenensis]
MAPPADVVPVASGSTTTLIRCSQCKTYKRPSDYPLRVINLEPYHVCLAHKWYWTPAKQANNWAPTTTTTLDQVCDDVAQLRNGVAGAQTSWMLDGNEADLSRIVRGIAGVGDWDPDAAAVRQRKKASDGQTSPMFAYNLVPKGRPKHSVGGGFRLNLYVHILKSKITLTMKAEDLPKGSLAWSRPDRWRSHKGLVSSEGRGGGSNEPADGSATGPDAPVAVIRGSERLAHAQDLPPEPNSAAPNRLEAALRAAAVVAAKEAGFPVTGENVEASTTEQAEQNGERRAAVGHEVMPPPAVPRPTKRARRVEPMLVSPMPTYNATSSTTSAFAAAPDWTRFLSFPTLSFPDGDIPIDPFLTTTSAPDHDPSSSVGTLAVKAPKKRHVPPPKVPPASVASNARPLSLAEMLSSSLFEPPDIDLPPRTTAPASSGTQHLQSNKHQAVHSQATRSAPITANAPSPAAALATQELVSALASLRDGLYARSTGQSPAFQPDVATPAPPVDQRPGDEDHESYYEDSIPDTSSDEEDDDSEDDDDDAAHRDIGSDMSSFFESSSEDADEGESAEEAAGEEDNWLEGFAAQQMGLRRSPSNKASPRAQGSSLRRSKRSRRQRASSDHDPSSAEAEIDELDDRSTPRTTGVPTPRDGPPTDEVDELDSQTGSGADA